MFPYTSVATTSTSSSPSSPSTFLHPTVLPLFSFPSQTSASLHTLPLSPSSQTLPVLNSTTQSPLPVDPNFQLENLCVVLPLSPMNLYPITTRSKNGISKRKAYSASVQSVDLSKVEPSSFKAASTIIE
jgi:hypothetical protein